VAGKTPGQTSPPRVDHSSIAPSFPNSKSLSRGPGLARVSTGLQGQGDAVHRQGSEGQRSRHIQPTPSSDAPASGRIWFVPAGAKQSGITSASDTLIVSTNLKRDFGNTERSLRDVVHLESVNALQVPYGRLTSANAAPTLKTFSIAFSVDSFISGE